MKKNGPSQGGWCSDAECVYEYTLQGFLLSVSMNTRYKCLGKLCQICLGKLFLKNININVCNNALPLFILKTNCN